jgi:hypothetical protein
MIFSLGIILMFVRLGINTTAGYLAHYATYMASRTYLVVENGARNPAGADNVAATEAKKVLESFKLRSFGITKLNVNQDLKINSPESVGTLKYEYVGIRLKHSAPLSLIPFLGPPVTLDLVTESFIGREPSRGDCLARICRAMQEARGTPLDCVSNSLHLTLFDNGC